MNSKTRHLFVGIVVIALLALVSACPSPSGTPSTLKPLTAADHERFFPIANGTNHEGADCASCHTVAETFRAFECITCHEHDAEAMNGTHAGFADYAYESSRCYGCHPKGDVALEVDHDRYFPVRGEVSHGALSCADCHKDPANRKSVSCTTCHSHEVKPMYGIHHDMIDYTWTSPACLTCHPGSEPVGKMEHPFFPTAAETKHEEASCIDCHASREDRTELACISCHEHEEAPMQEKHAVVPGYLWESSSCFLCHPNGEPVGAIQHTFFPIGDGAAHVEVTCIECHTNPESRTEVGCTTCHEHSQADMGEQHAAIPDYSFDSQACLFCHPNAEPDGNINHTFFPIGTNTAHDAQSCGECHTDVSDRKRVGCVGCHDHEQPAMAVVHNGIPSYEWDSLSCVACHPGAEPIGAIDHIFFPIAPPAAHDELDCKACHVDTQNRLNVGCTACHEHRIEAMNPIHAGMNDYAWSSPSCLTCHPSAQPVGLLEHDAFPTTVGTKHEALDCTACHSQQTDRALLACTTCHTHRADETNPIHAQIPNYLYESSSCFLCHPNAEPVGTIQHDPFFPIDPPNTHEGLDCIACHTNPTTRNDVGCITCHAHEEPEMANVHGAIPGYAWESSSCLLCHPNGEPNGSFDHDPLFPISSPNAHDAVDCIACHTNPTVQTEVGCATCHVANDTNPIHTGVPGYAHSSPACLGCHPAANNPGFLDHQPFFPITQPSPHAAVTCADCHASQTDRAQLSCASCHLAATTNPIHAAVPGYSHDSASCFACHPNGEPTSSFDHVAFFPIAVGAAHEDVSCAECHTNPNNQSELGCAQCHVAGETNSIHTGIPGYAHNSPACLTCHPYADVPGLSSIDHNPYFPIDLGTDHDGESCASCHLSTTDPTVNGCRECHATTMNLVNVHSNAIRNASSSQALDNSTDCKLCHADSQVHRINTHGPVVITNGPHKGRCLECHFQPRQDKPWALDFVQWSCIDCHTHRKSEMDDKHSDENGYAWTNPKCIECHPDGKKD